MQQLLLHSLGGAGSQGITGRSKQLWLILSPALRGPWVSVSGTVIAASTSERKPPSSSAWCQTVQFLPVWVWVPRDSPGTGVQSSRELVSPSWLKKTTVYLSCQPILCASIPPHFHTSSTSLSVLFSFLLVVEFPLSQPSLWFWMMSILSFSCSFDVVVRGGNSGVYLCQICIFLMICGAIGLSLRLTCWQSHKKVPV